MQQPNFATQQAPAVDPYGQQFASPYATDQPVLELPTTRHAVDSMRNNSSWLGKAKAKTQAVAARVKNVLRGGQTKATATTPPTGPTDVRIPTMSDLPPLPPASVPPAGAIVGKNLSDFKWKDSNVYPPGAAPEIPNIQQIGPATFCHVLRKRDKWHDGDRNMTTGGYTTKMRAEMTALGGNEPYKLGETWLIGSTVRLNPDFVPFKGYCNIMQPVLHQSYFTMHKLEGDTVTGTLFVFEKGLGSKSVPVRTVQFKRGEWVPVVIKVTFGTKGYYGLSVNGDDFQGFPVDTSIGHIFRNQVGKVKEFGGTWGLYSSSNGPAPHNNIVVHANPFVKKVS